MCHPAASADSSHELLARVDILEAACATSSRFAPGKISIEDPTQIPFSGPPCRFGRRQQRFEVLPLGVGQVARVDQRHDQIRKPTPK